MNKMLTVFNDKGNFCGNLEVSEAAEVAVIKSVLAPHRVEETVHSETATFTVKPMLGMSVNEDGFLNLIKATLRTNGLLLDESSLETGYGAFTMVAEFSPVGDGYESSLTIRRADNNATVVTLGLDYNSATRGVDSLACVADDINSLTETAQAFNSLISQGTEFLIGKLRDKLEEWRGAEPTPAAPEQPAQPVKQQPLPDDSLGKRIERVRAPGADKVQAHNVRAIVDNAVNSVKAPVNEAANVLAVLPVHPADRQSPLWAIIEMTHADYEQFVSEGVVTTLIHKLEGAVISNDVLIFNSSKGYLLKIREAMQDHGIVPVSITPREPNSINESDSAELVSLI